MNEEKKMQVAEMLTRLCFREADDEGTCPVGDGDNCPFPEKPCTGVTTEDWKAWMEGEE